MNNNQNIHIVANGAIVSDSNPLPCVVVVAAN